MIILAILASLAGFAVLCWLLFTLAVFTLPFFAALALGDWAYGTGSGVVGAIIVGAIAAAATFGLFQLLLLVLRPTWLKLLVALAFAAPAAIAGYHATLGIVQLTMPSETWRVVFAIARCCRCWHHGVHAADDDGRTRTNRTGRRAALSSPLVPSGGPEATAREAVAPSSKCRQHDHIASGHIEQRGPRWKTATSTYLRLAEASAHDLDQEGVGADGQGSDNPPLAGLRNADRSAESTRCDLAGGQLSGRLLVVARWPHLLVPHRL